MRLLMCQAPVRDYELGKVYKDPKTGKLIMIEKLTFFILFIVFYEIIL